MGIVQELQKVLHNKVQTSEKQRQRRAKDLSYHQPSIPITVVVAENEQDIINTLKLCNKFAVKVTTISGATSIEGQIIPGADSVVLDTSNMDRIIQVNEKDLDAIVEPGVNWVDLGNHLKQYNLFFPPDPGAAAMIGGMCGTNCSGTYAWKYGSMKDNVISMRVVLPDGTVIQTRRRPKKSSAGYDLTRLFIGSEGTLAVISQITLRLKPIPKKLCIVVSQFNTLEDAANCVQSGIPLERMEMLDPFSIRAANYANDTKYAEKTMLLFEVVGISDVSLKDAIDHLRQIVNSFNPLNFIVGYEKEAEKLWKIRKSIYFATKYLAKPGSECLTTDVAVPISRLKDMLAISRKDLDSLGFPSSIVCHAGDGNIHCLLLLDPNNPEEMKKAKAFRDKNASLAIEMGGTCTGEHGVGMGKIHLLEHELGKEPIELMRKLKHTIDPQGIMNPGKVFRHKL